VNNEHPESISGHFARIEHLNAYTRDRMQKIARLVDEEIPQGWGFAVLVFPFAEREGRVNYVSNGKRDDVIKIVRQWLDEWQP
jgi:hypothetical protein